MLANPGAAFRTWASAAIATVKHTWSWSVVRGPEATIEGLLRIEKAKAAQALAASGSRHGNARFFLSNVARSQPLGLPDITVD